MDKIAHFCQKCRAANEPGEASCHSCGTRLMIVTLPATLQSEEELVKPSYYEDHLLERVSLLEFRLKQVSEQLTMAYEFISRESESFGRDHRLITSFMEAIQEVEPNLSQPLAEVMLSINEKKEAEIESESKQLKDLDAILSAHKAQNAELFTHLVKEGVKLLEQDEEKQAFRTLERASLLSPKNLPLQLFIAERLFSADKFETAKKYLKTVYEIAPHNTQALLLLGVVNADEYKPEKARKMLSVLAGLPKTKGCANYVWGMLSALEGNWKEAIVAFKEVLVNAKSPEIFYLIGCAYFHLINRDQALKYLEKAVLEDTEFADAWFMISVICEGNNEESKARNARQMAFDAKETGAICLEFLRRQTYGEFENALAFLHFNEKNKRLLTNGSLRMTKFFRTLFSDASAL